MKQGVLLRRIIDQGKFKEVLEYGITADDFSNEAYKAIWGVLLGYYLQPETRTSVNPDIFEGMLYNFPLPPDIPSMTVDALCFEVRGERLRLKAGDIIQQLTRDISNPGADPQVELSRAMAEMSQLVALGTKKNTDVDLMQGFEQVEQSMRAALSNANAACMNWPPSWTPLQEATFGIQSDDYIIFYGRPKTKKSWILAYLISQAIGEEVPSIAYTKEMPARQLYQRIIACLCRLDYNTLRRAMVPRANGGKPLTGDDFDQFHLAKKMVEQARSAGLLRVLDARDSRGKDTVSWVESKIDQYNPRVCFIDGIYLMSAETKAAADHLRVASISRDLRQMVLRTGVPVIGTVQANRAAAKHEEANTSEIAFSDAFGQDATMLARTICKKGDSNISLVVGGSREYHLEGIRVHGVPATDFEFDSILTTQEAEVLKAGDAKTETGGKTAKKAASKATAPAEPDMVSVALDTVH